MRLTEAFRALDALNEDTFSFSEDGIKKLAEFEQNDDSMDELSIIDLEAETEEDFEDSYIGKIIVDCCVCHSKIYKNKEDLEIDEESGLTNVGEECPYCYTPDGFKIVGEVVAYSENVPTEEDDDNEEDNDDVKSDDDIEDTDDSNTDEDSDDVDESLNESLDDTDDEEEINEGIFGNKYKNKDILVYTGGGSEQVIAIADSNANNYNLINFKNAHMQKNKTSKSDYKVVAPTGPAVKKYGKQLKSVEDVTNSLPYWVEKYVKADKEKRFQDYKNAEAQKEREAKARQEAERDRYRNMKPHNPDDDYVQIKGKGTVSYKYREDLNESSDEGQDEWEIEYNEGATQRHPMPNDSTTVTGTWQDVVDAMDSLSVDLPGGSDEDDCPNCSLEQFIDEYEDNADLGGSTAILKITKNGQVIYEISDYNTWGSEDLDEGAFSGGMAGDNSINGGKVGGMGGSIHSGMHGNYLDRLASKNPDKVEITTIKGKDIKPGMITQAGEVKEATVRKNNKGETKVYIMHTNNYDGFWDVDEDMEVMANPENTSEPFVGTYNDLRKMGLQESVNNVNVETDDSIVNVSSDENGKVTVTTEPVDNVDTGSDTGEMVAPISPETEDEIMNTSTSDEDSIDVEEPTEGEEVDLDIDEIDEESFDDLGEQYFKENYENVKSFKTVSVKELQEGLLVEGTLTFDSGNVKKTSFLFESKNVDKNNNVTFLVENKEMNTGKSFTVNGNVKDKKLFFESLDYKYATRDSKGNINKVSGTVKRG